MENQKNDFLIGLFQRSEELLKRYQRKQELAEKSYNHTISKEEENEFIKLYSTINPQRIKDAFKMMRQVSLEVERTL